MAKHWDDFELEVRDDISEPGDGQIQQPKLLRWTNDAFEKLPRNVQLCKARIVVRIGGGAVTLAEEDWPGTEAVGLPNYQFGKDGTFWIKYCELVDVIRPILDMGEDDECGVYVADWRLVEPLLYKTRQEYITGYVGEGNDPLDYGVYRYQHYVPCEDECGVPVDPPRPAEEPFECWAVWLAPAFDPAAVDDCDVPIYRYYEVHYRRRPPKIDMTEILDPCGVFIAYAQPYFYIPEGCDDFVKFYVESQALFAMGDKRYAAKVGQLGDVRRKIKLNLANRGDVDYGWGLDNPDRVIRVTGINQ